MTGQLEACQDEGLMNQPLCALGGVFGMALS